MRELKKVLSDYIIGEDSIALLPAKSIEYDTIVYTSTGKLYVKMTPFEIIKASCLKEIATYEGRRQAVQRLTDFKHKVPILINSLKNIFSFPTASPANDDCIWFIYHQIKDIENNHKSGHVDGQLKSTVYFTNDTKLSLDISFFTLQQQYFRTAVCESLVYSQNR